jgi:hypothetical protein
VTLTPGRGRTFPHRRLFAHGVTDRAGTRPDIDSIVIVTRVIVTLVILTRVIVTLVILTRVIVTLVILTLVIVTLVIVMVIVIAEAGARSQVLELRQLDRTTRGVDHLGVLEDPRDRLAAADVGDGCGYVAVLRERLGECVGSHVVARGLLDQPLAQVGLTDRQRLGFGDPVEYELALERVAGLVRHLGAVRVVTVTIREVLLDLRREVVLGHGNLGPGK